MKKDSRLPGREPESSAGLLEGSANAELAHSESARVNKPPVYMTEADLSDRWRISKKTLANWRSAGLGPLHIKLNGAVRYRLTDILAYEQSNTRRSTSGGPRDA